MPASVKFVARDEAATERLGAALAAVLPPGTVVALEGPLGAGKTRLVQAIAAALNVAAGEVVSPTFVLLQQYQGSLPVYHFDAYRLRDEDEFDQLGPDEYFESPGLTFVEWASRVEASLPPERVTITIRPLGPTQREFLIEAAAQPLTDCLDRLPALLR